MVEEGEYILFSGPSRKEDKLNLKYLRRLGEGRRGAQGGWGWSRVRRRSGEHDYDVEDREGVTTIVDQPTERGLGDCCCCYYSWLVRETKTEGRDDEY